MKRILIIVLCCLQSIAFANMADDLSENYYFMFIYRSSCPHCHKLAPVVTDFAKTFHVGIDAYSIDGGSLKGMQGKPLTPALFQTLYVSGGYKPRVPALFLVNRDTLQTYGRFREARFPALD